MYINQFLLSSQQIKIPGGEVKRIRQLNLFCGPKLPYSSVINTNIELYLLGSLHDWEYPQLTDQQILENIAVAPTFDELLLKAYKYSGEFIIIACIDENIYLFSDPAGQREIYYDTEFTSFGTQPVLLGNVVELLPHNDNSAIEFYRSKLFKKKCLFVGESTHMGNIKHLLPNHFINITKGEIKRFFPVIPRKELSLDYVAEKASRMLKGFIEAVTFRNKTALAVTAGYDSRVLFLASLNTECEYYVAQHHNMNDDHYDISVPKSLTSLYNKEFRVIKDIPESEQVPDRVYIESIDFPRNLYYKKEIREDKTFINGLMSEIARNRLGYFRNATPEDLCFISGYGSMLFPAKEYDRWLQNKAYFKKLDYHYLDMFYWEETMGHWAAKARTEAYAADRVVTSPFNSRELLVLMLGVERKYRDSHLNKLYDRIISVLSERNRKVIKVPVNPSFKQNLIRLLKRMRLYNIYYYVALKTRTLKY